MGKIRPTFHYSLILGVFWASYAAVFAYCSVFLIAKGFTNSQIGYVIAAGGVLSALLQPVFGGIADKSRKCVLHKLITLISLVMILAAGLLLAFGRIFWVTALLYGCLIVFLQINTPLTNSIGMFFRKKGVNVDFGIARGIGSLAYAGLSSLLGILTENYSVSTVMYSVIIIYVLLIIFVLTFHFKGVDETNEIRENEDEISNASTFMEFVKAHKRFMIVLAGGVCLFISHNVIGNYMYQIVTYRGYTGREMGFATSLMAAAELPTLFLLTLILRRFKTGTLIRVASLFMFVKAGILVFATTIGMIYFATAFQMLGFGLFVGVSVYYVSQTIEPENQVRGQALMTMITTVGSVIGSFVAGILLDKTSVQVMLVFSAAIALVGVVIVGIFAEQGRTEKA